MSSHGRCDADSDPPLSKDTPQHFDSACVERDVAPQLSRAGRGAQ
jgi:hypothetical protein